MPLSVGDKTNYWKKWLCTICINMWADNQIDTFGLTLQHTDLSTDDMVFGPIHIF